jgi:hypothetical protein
MNRLDCCADAEGVANHLEGGSGLLREQRADGRVVFLGDGRFASDPVIKRVDVAELFALAEQFFNERNGDAEDIRDLLAGLFADIVAGEDAFSHDQGNCFHAAKYSRLKT